MLSDEAGKLLHDRATRGKILSPEEHNLLETWYNNQDNTESRSFKSNTDMETDYILQKQIDTILIKIKSASDNIQRLAGENKLLRDDIASLHSQLAEKMAEQTI